MWRIVLLKLKLLLCLQPYKEYELSLQQKIYCGISVPKIIKIELALTKLLQK